MSPIRPLSIRKPAQVKLYPVTIHCNPLIDTPNSLPIEGSATCTIVKSITTMNCAKIRRANTSDRREDEPALVDVDEFDHPSKPVINTIILAESALCFHGTLIHIHRSIGILKLSLVDGSSTPNNGQYSLKPLCQTIRNARVVWFKAVRRDNSTPQ